MSAAIKSRTSDIGTVSGTRSEVQRLELNYAGTVFPRASYRSLFSPGMFFAGTVIGFALCCLLGWITTQKNQFGDFQRFAILTGPTAQLYPTLAEMLAIARDKAACGKTLVVVGGSSVCNGVGQPDAQLWTRRLQELLGPKYAVVNFAMRACYPFDGGYYAAEALAKEGQKLIFVTAGLPHPAFNPLGTPTYAYLYWDAAFADRLMPAADRERAIADEEKRLPDGVWTHDSLRELKLARATNRLFYCCELWNAVSLRYFSTVYNSVTADDSFRPRKKLVPSENFESFPRADLQAGLVAQRAISAMFYSWDGERKTWIELPETWTGFTKYCKVPDGMKGKVVYAVVRNNPFYWTHLNPEELKRERLALDKAKTILHSLGVHSFVAGNDFEIQDYVDWQHFSASGGRKFAESTAVEVRKLARSLGYD